MDFGQWLVHKKWLKRSEYRDLMTEEYQRIFSKYRGAERGAFQSRSIDELGDDLEPIRELPFGIILEREPTILEEVLKRSRKSEVSELTDEWYTSHRDHLEPISEYCLKRYMGQQLYKQQRDKQLVARFLVDANVGDGDSIIQGGDVAVLFEGTSALYVGLAIAAAERDVTVHTSNSGLIREYRENPALQRGLHELWIIGGKANAQWSEVDGDICREQYRTAISCHASQTIVVVPLTRLTSELGPTARGPASTLRGAIVSQSFESDQLRYVVFIADFKKLAGTNSSAGLPIFADGSWPDLVEQHSHRMLIVTSPSPGLHAAREIARVYSLSEKLDVAQRDLGQLEQLSPFASLGFKFSDEDRRYDEAAKGLCNMGIRLFEAFDANGIGTEHVVFEFASPRPNFSDDRFLGLLSALGSDAVSKLSIYSDQSGANATFDVRGPAEVLEKVHQIPLTAATIRAAFDPECTLCSVLVEGINGGNSWNSSSAAMPVDQAEILRSAFSQ